MSKGYNQRNAKVDANQPSIVKGLRKFGAVVRPVHQLKSAFDILVGYNGNLFMIEIKNPDYLPKKYKTESDSEKRNRLESLLSEGERECMDMFKKVGIKYHIVSTLEEAIEAINKGKLLKF